MTANRAASIRTRLKRHVDATKEDFNLVLTHYGLERLLYRLSVSEHAPNFLLKGALLFQLWYGHAHRPTRDADLLGFGAADVPTLVEVFRDVCRVEVDDGIAFDPASVRGQEIRQDASYGGVRMDIRAVLDAARIVLQIDVGFGDAVTPNAQTIRYPTLVEGLPAPTLRVYSKVTVVAEKLHAAVVLGMANSRMKDYFDLWVLLRDDAIDDAELRTAIAATFERRKTGMPDALPIALSETFSSDAGKQAQWRAFQRKSRLDARDLAEVVSFIRARLERLGLARE